MGPRRLNDTNDRRRSIIWCELNNSSNMTYRRRKKSGQFFFYSLPLSLCLPFLNILRKVSVIEKWYEDIKTIVPWLKESVNETITGQIIPSVIDCPYQ